MRIVLRRGGREGGRQEQASEHTEDEGSMHPKFEHGNGSAPEIAPVERDFNRVMIHDIYASPDGL